MKTLPVSIGEYFALPPSDYCNAHDLVAGQAESVSVPDEARYALFSSTGDFYVNYRTAAALPEDVSDGSAAELNPTMRYVTGIQSLSLVAPADCSVTVSYYR
jgi:hypothetical protein